MDGNLRLKLQEKHEDSQIGAGGKARVGAGAGVGAALTVGV